MIISFDRKKIIQSGSAGIDQNVRICMTANSSLSVKLHSKLIKPLQKKTTVFLYHRGERRSKTMW